MASKSARARRIAETFAQRDLVMPVPRVARALGLKKGYVRQILRKQNLYAPYKKMPPILEALKKAGRTIPEGVQQELLAPPPQTQSPPASTGIGRQRRYSDEKIAKILQHATQTSVKEAAQKYKVSDVSIYGWRKRLNGASPTEHSEPAGSELERLRKENAELLRRIKLSTMELSIGEGLIYEKWTQGTPFPKIWNQLIAGLNALREA